MSDEEQIDELEQRRRKKAQSPNVPGYRSRTGRAKAEITSPAGHHVDGNQSFRAGQHVTCRILAPESGGYRVTFSERNLPAFMPTDAHHKSGELVQAQYVCKMGNGHLLQPGYRATMYMGDGPTKNE